MDVSSVQARIDAIHWYHEFDFGDGLRAKSRTTDVETHRRIWQFIEQGLSTVDFHNRTVLDVGCWDGFWSFYAERRGAKTVLAIDDFSQNWANESGLFLARELLGSQIETQTRTSVYDVASLHRKFDIVLMLGVYYHLLDPFHAFAQLRHCCHSQTIVCIEGNESFGLPANTAEISLSRAWSKFNPSPGYLRQLVEGAYFSISSERILEPLKKYLPPPISRKFRWRLVRKAVLGSDADIREMASRLTAAVPSQYEWLQRAFLVCTPFEGENPQHTNAPPFGLSAYDPRFASEGSVEPVNR